MRTWWTELVAKHVERAGHQLRRPVGVMTRAAAPDERRPAFDVGDIGAARAAIRDTPRRVADRPEAVDARTALAGTLGSEERHDVRGRGHAADLGRQQPDDPQPNGRPRSLITVGSRGMSQTSPMLAHVPK